MTTQGRKCRYLAYLLRLWQVEDEGELVWRALLETPGTGERRGFASLEMLCEFIQAETEEGNGQDLQDSQDFLEQI